jgi:curved DNA-binding protein CbpA
MRQPKSWGFPRWGSYDVKRDPARVRLCDHVGCEGRGDHPAPKSRHTQDKWWFCKDHAAEYNRSWNYFEGMSAEEAAKEAEKEEREAKGFSSAGTWSWGQASAQTSAQRDALATLEIDEGATDAEIKAQYRKLAKRYHPDTNPGDETAASRFHKITAAYELLTSQAKASNQQKASAQNKASTKRSA